MPKVIDLPTSTSMTNSDYLIMEESGGGTKKITAKNSFESIIKKKDINLTDYATDLTWQNRANAKVAYIPWSRFGLTSSQVLAVSVGVTSNTATAIVPSIDSALYLISATTGTPSYNSYHIIILYI